MLRQAFYGGPAYFTHDGVTYQFHENWDAKVEIKRIDRNTNLQGKVGSAMDYFLIRITGKPIATSANLATLIAKLHPYKASDKGKLIFPDTDKPGVIQTKDGRSLTLAACAVSKPPNVTFAPGQDLFDTVEWVGLLAIAGDSADITDFITETGSAYTEPALDPLSIISERYTLAWGDTEPFDEIETDGSGIVLEPSLDLKECITQIGGLLNYRINGYSSMAKFTPVNLASADFVDLIPAVGRGKMLGLAGQELIVTPVSGAGIQLTCPLAVTIDPTTRFGEESRVGEVQMELHRVYAESALQEPYKLEVIAPEEP